MKKSRRWGEQRRLLRITHDHQKVGHDEGALNRLTRGYETADLSPRLRGHPPPGRTGLKARSDSGWALTEALVR
jgi:hypothetical protein